MTGRPIVAFALSFLFLLFLVQEGNGQETLVVSKRNLSFQKVQELFDAGQYEQAKQEIDFLLASPQTNGIFSDREIEKLHYIQLVCGLSQGSFSSVQDAVSVLKKTSSKELSSKLAFYLSNYFFDLAKYEEALLYLEQTDDLFLNNQQAEQVQFQKGVAYFSQKKFDNASPYFKSLFQLKNSRYYTDVAYYLGFISFAEKKYKDALSQFELIGEVGKYKNIVPFYLSFIYHELGDTNASIRYGEAYIKSGDKVYQNEMLKLLGSLYFNNRNSSKAVEVYEQLVGNGNVLTNIQKFELGTSYYLQTQYDKAIQQLNPLSTQTDSTGLNAMYVLAQSYLGVNQKANARSSFGYCISGKIAEPKRELSLFYFSKLSFELGFQDQAINGLAGFIESYPSSKFLGEANNIVFTYYAKTNNFKKAIEFLNSNTKTTISDPSMKARVYFGRGMELINDLDYAKADAMMANAAQLKDPIYSGVAIFWRGELAYRAEKYDDAILFFTNYLSSIARPMGEANEVNALYSLGYAYFEKEDYKTALIHFEKIKINSSQINADVKAEVTLLIADCYFMQKNIDKAKSIYTKVYQNNDPGADYAIYQLSLIEGIKSPSNKIDLLKQAEKKFPTSDYRSLIYMELADTYLSEEQFESAIPYLKRIPQLVDKGDEMIPDAMLKLGIAHYNLDQTQLAVEQFRELLTSYPSTQQSAEALESAKILFVEKGKIEEYENFLKSSGKSLNGLQKDSLRYEVVQSAVSSADIQLAKKSMNQYLSEFPNGLFAIEVQHLLAELYVDEKDWVNAAGTYANLAERGASRYQEKSLRQAAKLYFFELKDYEKAANLFQQLTSSTSKPEVMFEALRGEVRSRYYLKHWMAGVRASEQLLANAKANQDDLSFAEIILGYFAQESKEFAKSSSHFKNVVKGNQSGLAAEARYQLASNEVEQGNLSEAETLATEAINLSGSNDFWITKSYILIGKIFFQQKDFFNAKATLKSVIENSTIQEFKVEAEQLLLTVESAEKNESK
jgi:tetratricopeptide (TPR) repeat protein